MGLPIYLEIHRIPVDKGIHEIILEARQYTAFKKLAGCDRFAGRLVPFAIKQNVTGFPTRLSSAFSFTGA